MFPNFFFSRHYILTLRQNENNSNDNSMRQSKNNSNDNNITKIICRLTNCAIIIRDEIKIILMIIIRDEIKIILMTIIRRFVYRCRLYNSVKAKGKDAVQYLKVNGSHVIV